MSAHSVASVAGVLRHAGWRVKAVRLPERAGVDPVVVAPAEVEIA